MQIGPLRRLTGFVGLVALVPTAVLLIAGDITAVDAAVRALVTTVGVVLIGRVTGAFLDREARRLEDTAAARVACPHPALAVPSGGRAPRRDLWLPPQSRSGGS